MQSQRGLAFLSHFEHFARSTLETSLAVDVAVGVHGAWSHPRSVAQVFVPIVVEMLNVAGYQVG
jgi:hypothetical protein